MAKRSDRLGDRASVGKTLAESTPWWPPRLGAGQVRPNVLFVLLDDVGFSDFGCYGSEIDTPSIDTLASKGLRFTGFHTTAMCSTTRAALYTGRNHHSVGMGSLANFDSGFPGYRGKIDSGAFTIAERLRSHGYRNYAVGKWHVTRLTETGPSGPFDGWPLARGFDRFYGFLDAETDQYSPELVRDNTHVEPPGNFESGYHLTADLFDQAINFVKGHIAGTPGDPWFLMVNPGACHAPHQAPTELIDKYAMRFEGGWDLTRERRLARQVGMGLVPAGTELPPRNDGVKVWDECGEDERRVYARLQGAYAAMLEHCDQQLARLLAFLESSGQSDTIIAVLSDNGASQEGGPFGFVNAMGPYNGVPEPVEDKVKRLSQIGGPKSHSNFPHGWAMAANTPLKRYKQNTHGGGIRDPLLLVVPDMVPDPGGLRRQFCHVSDLAPTLLDLLDIPIPDDMEGESFAVTVGDADAETAKQIQYFEMFGHRGLWKEGWKAVAFHAPGTSFDRDVWELYDLRRDFNECLDRAHEEPQRLAAMKAAWWEEAHAHQVLPLDDRFAARFAENAERHRGGRTRYELWRGMGHLPSDVAPDLRSRSYTITAFVDVPDSGAEGVLVAHGDATSGYALFVRDGHLFHDLNVGGHHQMVRSDKPVVAGSHTLGFRMKRRPGKGRFPEGTGTLLIDGESVGEMHTDRIFALMVSWSGLDVGHDRGTTVTDYDRSGLHVGPFAFTGTLHKVVVDLENDQSLDSTRSAGVAIARD